MSRPDLEQRNVRNRIVHDYLPEQVAEMFDMLTRVFAPELIKLAVRLESESAV